MPLNLSDKEQWKKPTGRQRGNDGKTFQTTADQNAAMLSLSGLMCAYSVHQFTFYNPDVWLPDHHVMTNVLMEKGPDKADLNDLIYMNGAHDIAVQILNYMRNFWGAYDGGEATLSPQQRKQAFLTGFKGLDTHPLWLNDQNGMCKHVLPVINASISSFESILYDHAKDGQASAAAFQEAGKTAKIESTVAILCAITDAVSGHTNAFAVGSICREIMNKYGPP